MSNLVTTVLIAKSAERFVVDTAIDGSMGEVTYGPAHCFFRSNGVGYAVPYTSIHYITTADPKAE